MTAIQEAHHYEYHQEHLKKTIIIILKKAGINMETDKIDIHSQNICNACNKSISHQATSISTIGTFQWLEHSQDNCSVCEHFRRHAEGGRLAKVTRGRLTSNPKAETLQATTQPNWVDSEPLYKHRFLSIASHQSRRCRMQQVQVCG